MLASADEFKLKAVVDILEQKLVKRKVPLKGLIFGVVTPAAGSTVRQEITLQQGIPIEKAREIVKAIKDSKKKVQASIQGDFVRVSGKDRDTLQEDHCICCAAPISASTCSSPITGPTNGHPDECPEESNRFPLPGPAGRLEALLEEPEDAAPRRSRAGVPSASQSRRHHAQQSGVPHRARPAARRAWWCCGSTIAA